MKKNEQSPRVMLDTIKYTNIYVMGVPEKERGKSKKKKKKVSFLNVCKLPNFTENINLYNQEAQQTPSSLHYHHHCYYTILLFAKRCKKRWYIMVKLLKAR